MDGLKVIEFGTYISGPLTGLQLSNFGAHVTCVRRPMDIRGMTEEYEWNPDMYDSLSKGKTVVTLDLRLSSQIEKAKKMIANSHILVENFRPGVMQKLGLDYETCKSLNPKLIFVSIPGIASSDPESYVAAYESIIMAKAGVFRDMGWNRQLMGVEASYSSLPLASVYGSIHAIYGILCVVFSQARMSRDGTTIGEYIEVPLLSALSESLMHNSVSYPTPLCYTDDRELCLNCGMKDLNYDEIQQLAYPFYCHYWCKDGRPIYVVAPSHYKHQLDFLKAVGLESEIINHPKADAYENDGKSPYGLGGSKIANKRALMTKIISIMKTKDSYEWEFILARAQVPVAIHRTTLEWLMSPHAQESGLTVWDKENMKCTLSPICWLESERPAQDPKLKMFESNQSSNKSCLKDITVLDLCNVIAGPTIGMYLAKMGADVIKIDTPTPHYNPLVTVMYGICANRGKKSVLLDIQKDRNELTKLISKADVIVVNATYDSLARLQLTEKDVYDINSSTCIVQFDAWSGPQKSGERMNHIGYDDNVQAAIGIMYRFGGNSFKTVEEHAHIGTIDVIAGVSGASSAILSLIQLYRTKKRSVGRASLVSTGQWLQLPMSVGDKSTMQINEQKISNGPGSKGEHVLHRFYLTKDCKWILIVASILEPSHKNFDVTTWTMLKKIFRDRHSRHETLSESYIESKISQETADYWMGAFQSQNIAISILVSLKELRQQKIGDTSNMCVDSIRFSVFDDHPIGNVTIVNSEPIRFLHRNVELLSHAPKYGIDTKDILHTTQSVQYSRTYLPYLEMCQYCGHGTKVLSKLPCGFRVCDCCRKKYASKTGFSFECPNCKNVHILSKSNNVFKNNYQSWRMGSNKGARQYASVSDFNQDQYQDASRVIN